MEKAVAYIRVSSQRQVDEGSSLEVQTKLVERFVESSGLNLVRIFREEGESAKTDRRPRLQEMLQFCCDRRNAISIVIVPKIDRLARNVNDYTNLKVQLGRMGVRLESLGEKIDDTPVGRFTETILASVAQFDNEIRAERSKGGMVEAVSQGRWVWRAPIGYRQTKALGKGTIEPDPIVGPLIQEAFRLLAHGHQNTRAVREFLAKEGVKRSESSFFRMLENEVYVGRIHAFGRVFDAKPPFLPLVDEETFYKVRDVIRQPNLPATYSIDSDHFPLRGTASCKCSRYFSGGYSRSKSGKQYAYYRCPHCSGRSHRKKKVHDFFTLLLGDFVGNPFGWERLKRSLVAYASSREASADQERRAVQAKIAEFHELRDAVAMKNAMGIIPDELAKRQIERLTNDIAACISAQPSTTPQLSADELVEFAHRFFTDLPTAWELLSIKIKKDLLRFMLPNGILFDPDRGFRTPQSSLLEQFSQVVSGTNLHLVDPTDEITKSLHEWLNGLHAIVNPTNTPQISKDTSKCKRKGMKTKKANANMQSPKN